MPSQSFPTDRVASLHLIDRRLWSGKPGVPSAVAELDKQALVGRATEVTFAEVTSICSYGDFLVLSNSINQYRCYRKPAEEQDEFHCKYTDQQ